MTTHIHARDISIRPAQLAGAPSSVRWLPIAFSEASPPCLETGSEDAARILDAAVALLAQGQELLRTLTVDDYTRRVPLVFHASIGAHYRHFLDHFTSLMRGLDADCVDYDHRERDVRIESQPEFALQLTESMRARLAQLPPAVLHTQVTARCEVSYTHGNSPATHSTVGRELVYCVAHAIHHLALISVMGRSMGLELPEHLGVAPSTVIHQVKHVK